MPIPDPEATRRRPLRPGDFPDWTAYYWHYQHELATEFLLPRLREWGVWSGGVRILDVGCGDAGATCALAEAGAQIQGLDIEPRRLGSARERARARGLELDLAVADITDASTLGNFAGPYDLILFRDVLEHIPDVDAALARCRERLAPGGSIVVIYPPYWSAYGGHQQTLRARPRFYVRWAKLPFVHWLPVAWWGAMARAGEVSDEDWEEVLTIRRARLTQGGLRARADRCGLRRRASTSYLLRPSYRLRYGVPVVGAGWLGRIPALREVVVSGVWELYAAGDSV